MSFLLFFFWVGGGVALKEDNQKEGGTNTRTAGAPKVTGLPPKP